MEGAAKKAIDVEVLEVSAHRSGDRILIDGRIRGLRKKPIEGIVLQFDFLAPSGAVISTQKNPTGEKVLGPGSEIAFHLQLRDEARAVQYQLNAEDVRGHELRVANVGPFPID